MDIAAAAAATARSMSSLPDEIQVLIFLKLPTKSTLSCKCVCKLWFNLISSPKFVNDHLNLSIQHKKNHRIMFIDKEVDTGKPLIYSVDHNSITSTPDLSCDYIGNEAVLMDTPFEYKEGMDVSILGACNGLICFGISMDEDTSFCIWNPATREYKEIPQCGFQMEPQHFSIGIGFGYDSKTGDYKMVRILEHFEMSDYCEVEVYTLGSHLSTTIRTFHYKIPTHILYPGVFLNGALHWMSSKSEQDTPHYIVSFDISNETPVDVPLPEKSIIHPEDSNTKLYTKLGVLGDFLSLVIVAKNVDRAELWMMQEYGVRESWTKLFTTTESPFTKYPFWMPVLLLKNGEILMYTYDGFVFCDPRNERVGKMSSFSEKNTLEARVYTMMMAHPASYIETLVSL